MSVFQSKYNQGTFVPVNKDKCFNYNGKWPDAHPITFRSSWERMLCKFCDEQPNVLAYGSELLVIPYYSEIDGKTHRYYTDFIMITRDKTTGKPVKYVIEVKPSCQAARLDESGNLIMPKPPRKPTQKRLDRWSEQCQVIKRNNEKWSAARKYCHSKGYIFKVVTEKELGLFCRV